MWLKRVVINVKAKIDLVFSSYNRLGRIFCLMPVIIINKLPYFWGYIQMNINKKIESQIVTFCTTMLLSFSLSLFPLNKEWWEKKEKGQYKVRLSMLCFMDICLKYTYFFVGFTDLIICIF